MAGKGCKDNRTPDFKKRSEAHDRIFNKRKKKESKSEKT